jgi:inner membrane protein
MKKSPLLLKLGSVFLLLVVLWIPLSLVREMVQERTDYRNTAIHEVARSNAGQQTVLGPFMYWPYTETNRTPATESSRKGESISQVTSQRLFRFPQTLEVDAQLKTQVLKRGVFPVTVYQAANQLKGQFQAQTAPRISPQQRGGVVTMGRPLMIFQVTDLRGLSGAPTLQLGGQLLKVASFSLPGLGQVLGAELPEEAWTQALPFELHFDLDGTGNLAWVPLGDTTNVALRADWPHPRFGGDFLPRKREIHSQGFTARWSTTSLASKAQQELLASETQRAWQGERMQVDLIEPLDIYQLTDRASKYGLMFVLLTFVGFFLFEMLRQWRIHPLQYLMVGAALTVFFLLLLSLAELLGFALAYALATASCVGLLTVYLSAVLGSFRASAGMGVLWVALYGLLYGILMSEDNALLMGTLLLFAALSVTMLITRKLDWYKAGV